MDTRFCESCGCKIDYTVAYRQSSKTIRGISFSFADEHAICNVCSEPVYVPEIHDANIDRMEAAYRKAAGLISVEEIRGIMEKYDIAANPLSKILAFGEVTIARYLAGQTPSKSNSDKLLQVSVSVVKMEDYLLKSQSAISEVAFRKCRDAINRHKIFSENPSKIEAVVQYLINQQVEITPMALQKQLYFSQAFYAAINGGAYMFEDDCQAWAHGPVYPDVYDKYREFGYNPIDSTAERFEMPEARLSLKELEILDQIIKTFGRYSGPILERITHLEDPWISARGNLNPSDRSTNLISKPSMTKYYNKVVEEYHITTAKDIENYCTAMFMRV